MTFLTLVKLRMLAKEALRTPVDPSTPEHERDLVVTAQDLLWLLDKVEAEPPVAMRTKPHVYTGWLRMEHGVEMLGNWVRKDEIEPPMSAAK